MHEPRTINRHALDKVKKLRGRNVNDQITEANPCNTCGSTARELDNAATLDDACASGIEVVGGGDPRAGGRLTSYRRDGPVIALGDPVRGIDLHR
jgi:hypothetical protein